MTIATRLKELAADSDQHLYSREFVGADLRGVDLSGVKLTCINLSNAQLNGANLTEAQLSHVILTGAQLQNTCLQSAQLYFVEAIGSDFSETNAIQSRWEHTNLLTARLDNANLTKATFQACTLDSADLQKANFNQGNLAYSICDRANFAGSQLANLETIGTSFRYANFAEAEQFFSCREIIVEILRQHINTREVEEAKLVGAVSLMARWCFAEWKEYLTTPDMVGYYALALDIFSKYPKSGMSKALEEGWNWRNPPHIPSQA